MSATTSNAEPQPVSNLPQVSRYITGHNQLGQAVVQKSNELEWVPYDSRNMGFSVAYTTSSQPADLNGDADVAAHEDTMASGKLGLVNPNGSVLRFVDFKPGYECAMHRTQSLDYGIVLEGSIDMVLDSGEVVKSMKRGDVAVQRATQHQWVNNSKTEWARMVFVLQDVKPLSILGQAVKEDLGTAEGIVEPSGN